MLQPVIHHCMAAHPTCFCGEMLNLPTTVFYLGDWVKRKKLTQSGAIWPGVLATEMQIRRVRSATPMFA